MPTKCKNKKLDAQLKIVHHSHSSQKTCANTGKFLFRATLACGANVVLLEKDNKTTSVHCVAVTFLHST